MQYPESAVERCYVVNLDRCPERWKRFAASLPADWPFAPPVRFAGIDGQQVQPPAAWHAGRGAWGVYRSFVAILERCLSDRVDGVLLLEDDALFAADFSARAKTWMSHVPENWGLLYLGGQHLAPPRKLTDQLYEVQNVNRCHAWAVSGAALEEVYQHLIDLPWGKTRSGKPMHVDHRLGQLHARHYAAGDRRVLCPPRWLVGQAAGRSAIAGKEVPDRYWKSAEAYRAKTVRSVRSDPSDARPVIVVLGPFRGGTSCTAGVLHQLGVSMGASWSTIAGNPKGTFEARRLAQFCRRAYKEPLLVAQTTREQRIAGLRTWLADRLQAVPAPAPIGAKHPSLCLMVSEILEAWPGARFVAVHRPLGQCVRSLAKHKNWGWPANAIEPTLRRLVETRDLDLARLPASRVLRIDYQFLVRNPTEAAAELAAFAGLSPAPEVLTAAAAWVDPTLWTVRPLPPPSPPSDPIPDPIPDTERRHLV